MYNDGIAVLKSNKTAIKWYTLAANQGHAKAQHSLGGMYEKGLGVAQDHWTAAKWYRLAAKQGDADSQVILGGMYAIGKGIIRHKIYAYMWADLATANGNRNAPKLREFVGQKMTSADISKAQNLAQEYLRSGYKGC